MEAAISSTREKLKDAINALDEAENQLKSYKMEAFRESLVFRVEIGINKFIMPLFAYEYFEQKFDDFGCIPDFECCYDFKNIYRPIGKNKHLSLSDNKVVWWHCRGFPETNHKMVTLMSFCAHLSKLQPEKLVLNRMIVKDYFNGYEKYDVYEIYVFVKPKVENLIDA